MEDFSYGSWMFYTIFIVIFVVVVGGGYISNIINKFKKKSRKF